MGLLVFDRLDMLVTSEPAAEIDGALAQAVCRLHAARSVGEVHTVRQLLAWIDFRLDDRCQIADNPRSDT